MSPELNYNVRNLKATARTFETYCAPCRNCSSGCLAGRILEIELVATKLRVIDVGDLQSK